MAIMVDFRSADGGSIPLAPMTQIALWSNGRTEDFDSSSSGSNPGEAVLDNWKVAVRGHQSVLNTDMPGESLWVRLLCLPCKIWRVARAVSGHPAKVMPS